ncbi:MAG TPA: hypothetical protein VLE97_01765 [Gaiellaceae bacterium]|nr:hypothetical protein [Gaiellaceae bacterium]
MRRLKRKPRLTVLTTRVLYALGGAGGAGATSQTIGKEVRISTRSAARRATWLAFVGLVRFKEGVWFLTDDARGWFEKEKPQ